MMIMWQRGWWRYDRNKDNVDDNNDNEKEDYDDDIDDNSSFDKSRDPLSKSCFYECVLLSIT